MLLSQDDLNGCKSVSFIRFRGEVSSKGMAEVK
jgi:hypothetical protein